LTCWWAPCFCFSWSVCSERLYRRSEARSLAPCSGQRWRPWQKLPLRLSKDACLGECVAIWRLAAGWLGGVVLPPSPGVLPGPPPARGYNAQHRNRVPCKGLQAQVPVGHPAWARVAGRNLWIPDPLAFMVDLLEV